MVKYFDLHRKSADDINQKQYKVSEYSNNNYFNNLTEKKKVNIRIFLNIFAIIYNHNDFI